MGMALSMCVLSEKPQPPGGERMLVHLKFFSYMFYAKPEMDVFRLNKVQRRYWGHGTSYEIFWLWFSVEVCFPEK